MYMAHVFPVELEATILALLVVTSVLGWTTMLWFPSVFQMDREPLSLGAAERSVSGRNICEDGVILNLQDGTGSWNDSQAAFEQRATHNAPDVNMVDADYRAKICCRSVGAVILIVRRSP